MVEVHRFGIIGERHTPSCLYIMGGIYMIINNKTGDRYMGSTINFRSRFITHKTLLYNNKHHNRHLQNSFNKYGAENFELKILLVLDNSNLELYEQMLISSLKPEFNKRILDVTRGTGVYHSEETKIKCGLSRLGTKISEETRERIRLNLSMGKGKVFKKYPPKTLISPEGELFQGISGITEFFKERGVKYSNHIYEFISGKNKSYFGWRIKNELDF